MNKPTLFSITGHDTDSTLERFPLLLAFVRIWQDARDAFVEERTHRLSLEIALGLLCAFGRRTITRSICARGRQFVDWTKFYRFFSSCRWFPVVLETRLLSHIAGHLHANAPFVVAVDDTHIHKTGKKIPGTGYFYDSKSPPFSRSFKWQMRFLTLSALLTPYGAIAQAKGILIKFKLSPKLVKPGVRAKDEEKASYRQLSRIWTITSQMIEQIHLLRCQMDSIREMASRILVIVADSSYCNKAVIRDLPDRSVLISRTRKDLLLYEPAESQPLKGRKRIYGRKLPTPEEVRKDDSILWYECTTFASGKWHNIRYKTVESVLWKSAGERRLRLVVIAPLSYRLRRGSKLLYRNPAYLLISDIDYPVHLAMQHYFHRWEIEVNHRDAKTTMGVGEAQVRNPRAVARQFSFAVLVSSWISLASLDAYGADRGEEYVPLPKWRNDPRVRPSALDVVTRLRLELALVDAEGQDVEFHVDRGCAPTTAKYAGNAAAWLAQTVPKGISEAFWSSILYADA